MTLWPFFTDLFMPAVLIFGITSAIVFIGVGLFAFWRNG